MPLRRDGAQRGDVRAAGPCLRVPCLRDVRLPQRGDRTGRPPAAVLDSRRRAARGDRRDARRPGRRVPPPAGAPADRTRRGRRGADRAAARDRLASGPGPRRAPRSGSHRLDRDRPVRSGVAAAPRGPAGELPDALAVWPRRGSASTTPGEPWAASPWRFFLAGHPSVSGPRAGTLSGPMDRRSIALLEFPAVRARLAEPTSFAPSRRLAEALEPSDDPVIVARGPRRDRPGPRAPRGAARASGSAAPTTSGRRSSGRPRRPARAGAVPRDRRHARRHRPPGHALADERRPLLRDLGQRPPRRSRHCARRWRAASTRSASCSTPPRRGSAACGPRSGSPTTGCAAASTRWSATELGSALQEPIVTLRNGRYVVPVKAEARGRVKGIVHDASGSGQTLFIEPLVVVELGNAWREAQVAEAEEVARILDELSALVAANAADLRETLERPGPVRLLGGQGRRSRPRWAASGPRPPDRFEVVLLSARHPGLTGPRRPDRHPARRRLHRARRDRPEHRRQDGHAADARAC